MRHGVLISLAGSATLGIGALAVAHLWAPSATRSPRDAQPSSHKSIPVVIATSALGYGVRLQQRDLTVAHFAPEAVPQGAFRSVDQVLNQAGGAPVVLAPMAAREPLLPSKLSGPGARPSLSAEIADGKRAYTIRVTDVSGVGGHALPGDHVDVVLTRDLSVDSRSRQMVSEVVIQDVRVLGIDLNANPTSVKAALAKTSTLEVTVGEAQKLAVASELGSLTLALRRSGAEGVEPVTVISAADITGASAALPPTQALRAPGPAARLRRPAQSSHIRASGSVRVIHGAEGVDVQVPSERLGDGA